MQISFVSSWGRYRGICLRYIRTDSARSMIYAWGRYRCPPEAVIQDICLGQISMISGWGRYIRYLPEADITGIGLKRLCISASNRYRYLTQVDMFIWIWQIPCISATGRYPVYLPKADIMCICLRQISCYLREVDIMYICLRQISCVSAWSGYVYLPQTDNNYIS